MQDALKPVSLNNRQYQIYALIDPRDDAVRYIGLSLNAHVRLYDHLLGGNGSNQQKNQWLKELGQYNLSPVLRVLEMIPASEDAYTVACKREQYWIQEMLNTGYPLLNIAGVTRQYVHFGKSKGHRLSKLKDEPVSQMIASRQVTEWLSVEDISKELDVTIDTVRAWIRKKKLRAYRVGRDYRIKRSDYDKFLEERATTPGDDD